MRGRVFFLPIAAAAVVACPGEPAAPGTGRLVLERTEPDPRTLLDAPARARYCARDSLVTIVAVDRSWSAAIALRTPWPEVTLFSVDTTASILGTAALAARRIGDSIGLGLVSRSGRVELDTGALLAGTFTIEVGPDSSRASLSGRFEGMQPDTSGCAST